MREEKSKDLIIIAGVTGALGGAFFSRYARQKDTIVYGMSRDAIRFNDFINPQTDKMYQGTFICSLDDKLSDERIDEFTKLIDLSGIKSVTYVHALGHYPFEIDRNGSYNVSGDNDGDGICDDVMDLTYRVFKSTTSKLIEQTSKNHIPFAGVIFGGIADKYEPTAHHSWCRTITKTKQYMQDTANKDVGMHLLNISSVTCPHELITRPYVFIQTDADPSYWLTPEEVVVKFREATKDNLTDGYHKHEFFHKRPQFDTDYYADKNFTPTKVHELYKKEFVNGIIDAKEDVIETARVKMSNVGRAETSI